MIEVTINDVIYRRGKNAVDNKQLILDSEDDWYWVHLKDYPSCHIVICQDNVSKKEIKIAKQLIMNNTKYKDAKYVSYCKIKNLIHEKEVGSVSFVNNNDVKIC